MTTFIYFLKGPEERVYRSLLVCPQLVHCVCKKYRTVCIVANYLQCNTVLLILKVTTTLL